MFVNCRGWGSEHSNGIPRQHHFKGVSRPFLSGVVVWILAAQWQHLWWPLCTCLPGFPANAINWFLVYKVFRVRVCILLNSIVAVLVNISKSLLWLHKLLDICVALVILRVYKQANQMHMSQSCYIICGPVSVVSFITSIVPSSHPLSLQSAATAVVICQSTPVTPAAHQAQKSTSWTVWDSITLEYLLMVKLTSVQNFASAF